MEQRLHFLGCRDGHHVASSLSDFFDGADQWGEVLALLPVLVLLELILSADNAVALAAIARSSRQPEREGLALNLGIGIALVLRIALIVVAQWVLQNAWVQLIAAAYLVWLVVDHFNDHDPSGVTRSRSRAMNPTLSHALFRKLFCCLPSQIWPSPSIALPQQWPLVIRFC